MTERILLIIAISFLSVIPYPGFSQNAFRNYMGRESWRLPYTGKFPQKNNYGNAILEELAKDLLKPPGYVDLTINFLKEISLRPGKQSSSMIIIRLSGFRLSGYLQYRSFPMTDVLMPSGFRFGLKVSDKLDTGTYSVTEFEGNDPGKANTMTFRANGISVDTAVDTLIAGNFFFDYSEACWQRFYARKNLIDDYYASGAMVDSLSLEVQKWDMRVPSQLPFNFIRLSELVRILEIINERDFGKSLINGGGDSRHLQEKNLALYKTSRTCFLNLAETLEKQGTIKGFGSLDSINDYFIERLMKYIRLNSLMDNIQGRIYLDYLKTYFSKHVFEKDDDIVQSMLIRIFPNARPDTLLSFASESLMQAYRRKAKELITEKQYSDAVLLMENARSMAAVNPYLKIHNGWEHMMSEAVNGIYNSYAGIASSSLEGGNVSFAMEYLQQAEKYREQYPVYITSDSVYRRVYRAIFIGQLEHCYGLLGNGNYSEALECLNSCEQSYTGRALDMLSPDIAEMKTKARTGMIAGFAGRTLKALKQSQADSALSYFDKASGLLTYLPAENRNVKALDSLAPSIAAIRVRKINELAIAYFRQRQFSRAILQFEQAGKIAAAYSIRTDPVNDSLYHQSYKQWLLDRISREQRLIWNNKSDSAGSFLSLAMETAGSKGLAGDPDILRALALYKSGINNHICELMEDSLVLFNIRAGRCFAIHNYNSGVKILQYAIYHAGRMESCNLEINTLQDSVNKYKDAADYLNNLDEISIKMAVGEYEKGMQMLAFNEKFYSAKRIDHFGILLTSVYDYVMMKSNPFISMQALDYYISRDDPVEAIRYLMLLHVQGMPDDRSSIYQEKLARSLAARDKLVYRDADPQNIVLRYTASNSWMSRFREVYIQDWGK